MTKIKFNNSEVAISDISNREALETCLKKGIIGGGFAGDDKWFIKSQNASPIITTPNIQALLGNLNYIQPKAIQILTATQTADRISTPVKLGNWGMQSYTTKIKEFNGKLAPDDGSSNDTIKATTNYDFFLRGFFPICGYWGNTDLARETVGAINENLQSDDSSALMLQHSIARNQIFFTGVSEKNLLTVRTSFPVYGLLNDPNLEDYSAVDDGSSLTNPKYWSTKTPQEIFNDINNAYTDLNNKSAGNIANGVAEGRGKLKLIYASGSDGYLNRLSAVGAIFMNAKQFIKQTFPEIEFISVPQMNSANASTDVFYLMYEEEKFGKTILNGYSEMARAYPIFQKHSEFSQKISASVCGCSVQIPMFIVRRYGIGASTSFDQLVY